MYATYYTGPVKPMPPDSARKEEWSDIEWQVRNWYNFTWCGAKVWWNRPCTASTKSLALWRRTAASAVAVGGRQRPNNSGNISGSYRGQLPLRKRRPRIPRPTPDSRCHGENNDYIYGTKGRATIARGQCIIQNEDGIWRYEGPQPNMYQVEHDEMYASIRDGNPSTMAPACNATMMGIMGRIAGYTGKQVTWDQALNSKQNLFPKDQNWETGKHTLPAEAIPGTKDAIAPHGWA